MTSRMAGQTINDRFLAAKHSIAGQGLAKSVCKATTEEMIGPKKKHLDYLVHCTNEPNVSIPQMANLLIERSQNTNWIVVYKALVTVHHVMCYGNERFTQYLASNNCTFQLSNFLDKSGVQGALSARAGYDMSPFIRRYSRYLNEKALSYRTVAFDFCKVKRGKEDGLLRTMSAERLLKSLPALQSQLDALLEFDCSANDLTNGVINMCFMLLFRDVIRLFACYNDGIINLLEKYFDMNKKQCKDGLDIYRKFLIRMDKVAEFLRVAENVGIDKGDIPDLTKAPSSLLDALEQHLNSLDGKKTSTSSTPSQISGSNHKSVSSGLSALSSTSNAFGTAVANGRLDTHSDIDEQIKQQVLAEEEAAINQFKTKVHSPNSSNNPFLSNTTVNSNSTSVNLLDNEPALLNNSNNKKASDDLLQLGNPFVDAFAPAPTAPAVVPVAPMPVNNAWITNGNGYAKNSAISNGVFVSESSFESVFGSRETKAAEDSQSSFNPFLVEDATPSLLLDPDSPNSSNCKPIQDVLNYFQKDVPDQKYNENINDESKNTDNSEIKFTPEKSVPPPRPPPPTSRLAKDTADSELCSNSISDLHSPLSEKPPCVFTASQEVSSVIQNTAGSSEITAFDGLGGVLQPSGQVGQNNQPTTPNNNNNNHHSSGALITGDLDSSLASLAENLTIRAPSVKGVQWNSPKNGSKTGISWTPQPLAATTGANYKPMNQTMTSPPPTLQQPLFPQVQPVMGLRPLNTTMYPQRIGVGGATPPASMNTMGQQQFIFN